MLTGGHARSLPRKCCSVLVVALSVLSAVSAARIDGTSASAILTVTAGSVQGSAGTPSMGASTGAVESRPNGTVMPSGWGQLQLTGAPTARSGAAMTYDPADGYVLLFGGYDGGYLGDTWEFKGGAWTQITQATPVPSPRDGASMVYEEAGGYVLLFGGYNGAYQGDTWAFKGGAWAQLTPLGTPPSAREGSSMTYDGGGAYVLLFGGFNGAYLGDTYRFKGGTWTQLTPPGPLPGAREGADLAYEPAGGFALLFGGCDGTYLGDTWGFKGGNWTEISPASPALSARRNASMAYDATSGSMLLFGGYNGTFSGSSWVFNGGKWAGIPPVALAPQPREGASMFYDAGDGYVLLFGGFGGGYLGDTWAFKNASLEGWAEAPGVSVGYGSAMTFDKADGYTLLFGGLMNTNMGSTWMYKGGAWTKLETPAHGPTFQSSTCYLYSGGTNTSGLTPCPSARYGASMTYDPGDGYVLLYGGYNGTNLGDTWGFKGGLWTQIHVASPPGRSFASMAYDEADGYVLLFGGNNLSYLADTWEYKSGVWTPLTPPSNPTGRFGAGMVFDDAGGYVVLYGGYGCTSTSCGAFSDLADTWEFKGGAWTELYLSSYPSERYYLQMVYDQADGYVLLFGGRGCVNSPACTVFGELGDTWKFQGGTWVQLESPAGGPSSTGSRCDLYQDGFNQSTQVSCPSPRYGPGMAYDLAQGNVLIVGGYSNGYAGDGWVVSFPPEIGPLKGTPSSIDLGQSVTFSLGGSGGSYPFTFVYTGLPTGCSTANTTSISCIPSNVGASNITVAAKDVTGYPLSISAEFTVYLTPKISSVTPSRPSADVGQRVNFTANRAPGINPSDVFAWNASSTGLGCSHSNSSVISCVPWSPGTTYQVRANLTDSSGLTSSNVTSANFTVYSDPVVSIPSASVHSADVGQNVTFNSTLRDAGSGSDSYRWNGLPDGCVSVDSPILGPCTISAAGRSNVSITVNDSNGFNETSSALSFSTYGGPVVTIPVANRTSADVGQIVEISAVASGGLGPSVYLWTAPSALGCAVSNTSSITCDPAGSGNLAITVSVTDANGVNSAAETLNFTVFADPSVSAPVPSPTVLDAGQNATFASTLIYAGSGSDISTWRTSSPSLICVPVDLTTARCSAKVSGDYNASLQVSDSNGGTGEATSPDVQVASDPVVEGPMFSESNIDLGQNVSISVSVVGGIPNDTFVWSGLPPPCRGNGSKISCTPSNSGTYTIQVSVTDAVGFHVTSSPGVLTVIPPTSGSLQTVSSAGWEILLVMIAPPIATAIGALAVWRKESEQN